MNISSLIFLSASVVPVLIKFRVRWIMGYDRCISSEKTGLKMDRIWKYVLHITMDEWNGGSMPRIRLIHWNAGEAKDRARRLQGIGYEVNFALMDPGGLREMREKPPDAFVIDLSRLPSQGRDVGMNIRKYASTRHVPILFVGGDPEKVKGIKNALPDATYTNWEKIQHSLRYAIENPLSDPVTPESVFDVYKGTPLQKKLGLKPNISLALLDAPHGFDGTLGELPEGITLQWEAGEGADLTLWFTKSKQDLEGRIEEIAEAIGEGNLWIIWPKKASGVETDLSQIVVRKMGLDIGLVDFKICSVDETWSGLCFTRRKK